MNEKAGNMGMDDSTLLDAADAYDSEHARWSIRYNKAFSPGRHEVFRSDDNGEPVVQASTTGEDTAITELEEMQAIAAMKAALVNAGATFPGDIVEIEVPARSSTSPDGLRYRGRLVSRET